MRAPSSARLASCCVALLSAVALVGCSPHTAPPVPANTTSGPSPTSAASSPSSSSSGALKEPATTNTLPPPPPPTRPAPSTADGLSARSLPVPAGWRTAALPGSDEEGFQGNGTWVHARDPRYAAQDVITLGCSLVTRDDYTDPSAALEGNYKNHSRRSWHWSGAGISRRSSCHHILRSLPKADPGLHQKRPTGTHCDLDRR